MSNAAASTVPCSVCDGEGRYYADACNGEGTFQERPPLTAEQHARAELVMEKIREIRADAVRYARIRADAEKRAREASQETPCPTCNGTGDTRACRWHDHLGSCGCYRCSDCGGSGDAGVVS